MAQAAQTLDPIPLYVGDDWSLRFAYREVGGNLTPIDLTGAEVRGFLFAPHQSVGVPLLASAGLAEIIGPADGQFDLRVPRATTAGIQASPNGGALQVCLFHDGLLRTLAVWPLRVLDMRQPQPFPLANRVLLDPVAGTSLTFEGWGDAPPISAGMSADFSLASNSALLTLLPLGAA